MSRKAPKMAGDFATSVTAIWAGRGGGKTTLARAMIERAKLARVLILDPIAGEGARTVQEAMGLLATGAPRVVLASSHPETLRNAILAAYLASSKTAPLFVVCDEAPLYLDRATPALKTVIFRGRHRALGMLLLGQRPTAVDATIRSQAAVTYWGRMTDHRDLQNAAQSIGPKLAQSLTTAAPGSFIHHPPTL
ncbi:hypothetical protein [Rhodobacter capsulatus]|uniref:hypothetical protein n=1 Tax=Rhodobacter capsulatus TaxID=1061 RepID=UPI0040280F0A